MSPQEQVSARGERAALGGYMPQFSEFARFVYRELVNNRLEWLRLADPEAGKLDDIMYATLTKVHAYQVKWSIAEDILSFAGFKELLPGLLRSWQRLGQQYGPNGKRVVGHLLTSKPFSVRDRLLDGETGLGSFTDFYQQVWRAVQQGQTVPAPWAPIVTELVTLCRTEAPTLSVEEFLEFVRHFQLHPAYNPEPFSVTQSEASREDAELSTLRSFLMEQVGSPERRVEFTAAALLQALNWGRKFQPAFNHELVVDTRKYQPISRTLAELAVKLREYSGGYLFLEGSPGSGKSTLLTQWVKERPERVIRYYAFDFLDPSSAFNTTGRGDAASLYFDLVVQLRQHGFYPETMSPYRGDLVFLLRVFEQQLAALAEDYARTSRATILLIDGLDHVPREYREAAQSFLRELPAPDKLPTGVYIVLGSQTYELNDLRPAVRELWRTRQRTVTIAPLSWPEGQAYIAACPLEPAPTPAQQQGLFDKSQGHPLYLAYLCGRVEKGEPIEHVLATAVQINGDIVAYYEALWQPIARDPQLVELLGLVARVNGTVSPIFLREWNFPQEVGRSFCCTRRPLTFSRASLMKKSTSAFTVAWLATTSSRLRNQRGRPTTTSIAPARQPEVAGRKRHIEVDTQGLPLAVPVQAASVQDPVGAAPVLAEAKAHAPQLQLLWADARYQGPLVATAAAALGLRVEVVRTPPGTKGFVVLPRRWVVERTFGWLSRYRRVAGRDYETNPRNSEAIIKACFCYLILRRLTKVKPSD